MYCAPRWYLPSRSKYNNGLSMEPTVRTVSGSDIAGSSCNRSNTPLDWSKCLFCQKDTSKKLVCPADYSDRLKGAGYKTIAEALQAFNDLGCLLEGVKASLAWTMVMDWSKHSLAGEQNSTQHTVSDSTKMKFKVLLNGRCMQMMKLPLQRRNNSPLKNYSEKMTP